MPITTFNTTSTPGTSSFTNTRRGTGTGVRGGGNSNNSYISPGSTGPGDEYNQLWPMALTVFDGSSSAISFPGVLFEEDASNALSIHTYPNLPNARVENLAANPTRYKIRAVLSNRIYPATTENWTAGTLFPNNPSLDDYTPVLIQLRNLLSGTTSDLLFGHPIDGNVCVQVEKWSFHLMGSSMRDGCYFDIEMVTTIPTSPLATGIPARNGIFQAASSTATAYNGLIPYNLNVPGLSLGNLFPLIANQILAAVANPLNSVPGLGTALSSLNSASAVISSINYSANAIANYANNPGAIFNNVESVIQGFKTILGATPDPGEVSSSNPISTSNSNSSSYAPAQTLNYSNSASIATQSILALNAANSMSAAQFLQNVQRALINLQQYYIDQNNILCAPMIEALKQMNYQVLLQASSLNSNSTLNTSTTVTSFVTIVPTTLVSIARQYRQDIDDVLFLNPTLTNQILVAINETVYYYQGT